MNTLSVCTFDETMQLAVSMNGQFCAKLLRTGQNHSENLMPGILSLLSDAGLKLGELDLLCCTRGPGSFTGLRIGMAALKGLACSLNKPLVSVSTMEVLAHDLSFFPGAVVPLLDARKQRYYSAVFSEGRRVCPDMDSVPEDLAPHLEPFERILFTGPSARPFANLVMNLGQLAGRQMLIEDSPRQLFSALAHLAEKQFNTKGPDDIGQGPSYIRKSDAEDALEKNQERKANE